MMGFMYYLLIAFIAVTFCVFKLFTVKILKYLNIGNDVWTDGVTW